MNNTEHRYSIGQAAARSGLSPHTIRKWEARYGAVSPQRSAGGTRSYSDSQVNRLRLLKALVNAGHGIGGIATVATDKLTQLRSTSALWDGPDGMALLKAAVVGPTLPQILAQNRSKLPGLDIVIGGAKGDDERTRNADVIIVEIPALDESAMSALTRIREGARARCVVIAYSFATHRLIERLTSEDTVCLRMPLNLREVQRAIDSMLANNGGHSVFAPVPRRYSSSMVAKVAATTPTVACECPRHVAEIVSALTAFETYSVNCESTNSQDASLHNYLGIAASHARAVMESALSAVAAHENIPLEQWQAEVDDVDS